MPFYETPCVVYNRWHES